MKGIAEIYKDKAHVGSAYVWFYISQDESKPLEFIKDSKKYCFSFKAKLCLKREQINKLFKLNGYRLCQTFIFDIIFEDCDLVYVFKNCWVNENSFVFFAKEYIITDVVLDCEKFITYTKERYAMECNNGKCNSGKQDLKDKAIKMLRDSFEKQLKSVEKIACRKNAPSTDRARKELLDKFELYLKELLVC